MTDAKLSAYQKHVREKLKLLVPVLARASVGDFSKDLPIPADEDEFSELFVGIQLMLDVIREKIAELTQLNDRLEHKIEEVQGILKSVGDALVVIDREGKITLMNKEAAQLLGMKIEETLGKPFLEVVKMENQQGFPVVFSNDSLQNLLINNEKVAFNYLFVRPDRSKFPADSVMTPLKLHEHWVGAVLVFRDITKLTEVDQAKTEFVSTASHQLRTPLTAIGWYTENLLGEKDGQLNHKQKQALEEISVAKERMAKLVTSLLDISRLEMGTYLLKMKKIDLVEIAEEALKELERKISAKHLRVIKNYQKNLPLVKMDPNVIKIIFQNLLSNAVKYTKASGLIEISIKINKRKIEIKVADNGMGIPATEQEKIFTQFFRASNTEGIDPGGAGLGMHIVKALVKRVKGDIWFESKENLGTSFYISLPVAVAKD